MGCLTAKASGEIASFISPTITPIESARVYFSPTQLGEGTPSPENVREIVGRTSVELYQCGKNLFDKSQYVNNYRLKTDGTNYSSNDYYISSFIPVKVGNVYVKNSPSIDAYHRFCTYSNADATSFIRKVDNSNSITIASNERYIRFCGEITEKDTAQLELGSTATPYEPYQGKTIPFSWKRLPDEYQEVEYIESDGGQYIDLNYYLGSNDKVKIDVNVLAHNNTNNKGVNYIFGTYSTDKRYAIQRNDTNSAFLYNVWDSAGGFVAYPYQTRVHIEVSKEGYFLDGNLLSYKKGNYVEDHLNGSFATTAPSYLFWANGTSQDKIIARIYGFTIENNSNTQMNLIPCYRKFDNEIGLYDTVSQTFFTNQGNSTFTKGEDVSSDVFSDEVYGGYVDLVKGEIVDEYHSVPYTAWSVYKQNNGYICYKAVQPNHLGNWYCNVLNTYGSFSSNAMDKNIIQKHGSTLDLTGTVYMALDENVDISTVQVIYKKAVSTPIAHPLPDYLKTQLQTLKNENTFWSDADSVEIDYGLAETFDIQKAKRKIIMNQPHVESVSGDTISFTTDMKAPLKECKVSFMPVQEGSGDPSPSNVRNIVGWSGVSVTRCGKNLFGGDALYQSYLANSNNKTVGEDENGKYIYIYNETSGKTLFSDFKPNTQYTFISKIKRPISSSISGLRVEYIDGTIETALTGNITDGLGYLKWKTNKNKSVKKFYFLQRTVGNYYYYENFGIFEGDVNIEDYESYQGTTYSIDWTNDVGTVYGGYVDLVSGKLVQEWVGEQLKNVVKSRYHLSTTDYYAFTILPTIGNRLIMPNGEPTLVKSSIYKTEKEKPISSIGRMEDYEICGRQTTQYFLIKDDRFESKEAFIESVGEEYIYYPLETPITYQLTPEQLITLKGQNNISADTNGTINVKYWTH